MPAPLVSPPAVAMPASVPYCADQISIRFLPRDASSPASSDTARVLALHNIGDADCEIDQRPSMTFRDVNGTNLKIQPITGFGGHGVFVGHGPAMPRITIPAGRTATTSLEWEGVGPICSEVHSLVIDDHLPTAKARPSDVGLIMPVRMCGKYSDYIDYKQSFLKLEP